MCDRPEPCDWCQSAEARKWREGAHVCRRCAAGHDRQKRERDIREGNIPEAEDGE